MYLIFDLAVFLKGCYNAWWIFTIPDGLAFGMKKESILLQYAIYNFWRLHLRLTRIFTSQLDKVMTDHGISCARESCQAMQKVYIE